MSDIDKQQFQHRIEENKKHAKRGDDFKKIHRPKSNKQYRRGLNSILNSADDYDDEVLYTLDQNGEW